MLKTNLESIIHRVFILLGCKLRAHPSKIYYNRWHATVAIYKTVVNQIGTVVIQIKS